MYVSGQQIADVHRNTSVRLTQAWPCCPRPPSTTRRGQGLQWAPTGFAVDPERLWATANNYHCMYSQQMLRGEKPEHHCLEHLCCHDESRPQKGAGTKDSQCIPSPPVRRLRYRCLRRGSASPGVRGAGQVQRGLFGSPVGPIGQRPAAVLMGPVSTGGVDGGGAGKPCRDGLLPAGFT